MSDSEPGSIVLDNGSGIIKAGFSEYDDPKFVFPSIIGKQKNSINHFNSTYIGDEALGKYLTLNFPLEHGVITNWDDMENIWNYTFDMLTVSPEEHPLLLTETLFNPKPKREKMTNIMFEVFSTPSLYVIPDALLPLFSSGRITGVILNSGHGVTTTVSMYNGYPIFRSAFSSDLGGSDLTEYLERLLNDNESLFKSTSDREIVRKIKERFLYVATDFDEEMKKDYSKLGTYELPDGNIITLGNEIFKCSEILFQPNIIGMKDDGVHKAIFNSIGKTDKNMRKELFSNVVLSGGNSTIPGFEERMKKELTNLAPTMKINIVPEILSSRKYSAWLGGSILASRSTFQQMWITKDEYDEEGPCIVHRKCKFF